MPWNTSSIKEHFGIHSNYAGKSEQCRRVHDVGGSNQVLDRLTTSQSNEDSPGTYTDCKIDNFDESQPLPRDSE